MQSTFKAFFLFLLFTFSAYSKECQITRAAFDLGSSSFKVKVAKIDLCQKIILKILLDETTKTAFKDSMLNAKNGKIIPELKLKDGAKVISGFYEKAKNLGAKEFFAVGTQVFREINNSEQFLKLLPQEINVKLASQEEEAQLGLLAAKLHFPESQKTLVVWDIGGGSQQIIYQDTREKSHTYLSMFASNAARDFIKEEKKISSLTLGPNPIGKKAALKFIEKIKLMTLDDISGNKMAQEIGKIIPQSIVVGIGSLHSYSALKQVNAVLKTNQSHYTIAEILKTLETQATKDDQALESSYADTEVSNLILVSGFMQAYGINRVDVVAANLTDALLVFGF